MNLALTWKNLSNAFDNHVIQVYTALVEIFLSSTFALTTLSTSIYASFDFVGRKVFKLGIVCLSTLAKTAWNKRSQGIT